MSTHSTHGQGSITTLADRVVSGVDGDRPIQDLLADLRAEPAVESAELRVETTDGEDGDETFLDTDDRELQAYGYSTRFPFTRAAIQVSGFEAGEPVDVYAREGAILLVSTDAATGPRLREVVGVELNVANVPGSLAALLVTHNAQLCPETVEVTAAGTLAFSVVAPTEFEHVTERDLRPFGSGQTILTVPKGALESAGLDTGDMVDVQATTGAVLLLDQ